MKHIKIGLFFLFLFLLIGGTFVFQFVASLITTNDEMEEKYKELLEDVRILRNSSSVACSASCHLGELQNIVKVEPKATNKTSTSKPPNEKWVISFGLYGASPKYNFGAIRNVELQKQIFPEWTCRFYVDTSTVPATIVAQLKKLGAEVIAMNPKEHPELRGSTAGMFWRFLVVDDPTVDRFIVRDSDSRLNLREKFAIDEWIESGVGVHSLRDHVNHNYPFNGGMWGARKGAVPSLMAAIKRIPKDEYFADMAFLSQVVYPAVKGNMLAHDSFHCQKWPNSRSFPTRRFGFEHCGGVFDENDKPRQGDLNFFNNAQSPLACRRKPEYILG